MIRPRARRLAAKYSAEAQPARLRRRDLHLRPATTTLRRGRQDRQDPLEVRGATSTRRSTPSAAAGTAAASALGDGMVFIGQLDGNFVALDQKTGKVVWRRRSRTSRTATASPPRRSTSTAGHHRHLGRRVRHPRPRHGARRQDRQGGLALLHDPWPGRDRPRYLAGRPTTPGSTAARRSGRRRRSTPSSGMIYFTTGNAVARHRRLRARGRQPVHRVDRRARRQDRRVQVALPAGPPRHLGLRRAEPDGALRRRGRTARPRKGIGEAGQDRLAVPARPRDRQAARPRSRRSRCRRTPYQQDRGDPALSRRTSRSSPHAVDDRQFNAIKAQIDKINEDPEQQPKLTVNRGEIFDPQEKDAVLVTAPDASGGTNWQPSSYNPNTGTSTSAARRARPATPPPTSRASSRASRTSARSSPSPASATTPGT